MNFSHNLLAMRQAGEGMRMYTSECSLNEDIPSDALGDLCVVHIQETVELEVGLDKPEAEPEILV